MHVEGEPGRGGHGHRCDLRRRTSPAGLRVAAVLAGLLLLLGSPATAAVPTPSPRPASEALLLIVDASGSMRRDDGTGSTRLDSAKRALDAIISELPDDIEVGMRVYGHRVPSADKAAACQDTQLVVPVGPLDRDALRGQVQALRPVGETPIGLSLREAAADLPDGVASTIILVSDGSDECWTDDLGPEPCAVTRQLVAAGLDLRLETIGLQVEPAGVEQLQCMAEAGGGQFTSVADAGLLAEAISAAQDRGLRVFQPRGERVSGGPSLIDATALAPGTYQDQILSAETLWYAVDVPFGGSVTARVTMRTSEAPADGGIALEWQDEEATRVQVRVQDSIAPGQATTLAVETGPVDGSRSPYGAERDPGRYYLAVRTGGFPEGQAADFVLELLPSGTMADASDDADGPGGASVAPSAPAAGPPAQPRGPAPSLTPVDELPPPPSTSPAPLVLLLLVLAAGGGAYLWWRRRRDAEQDPDEPTYS